jgi:hypothetical protein
MTTIKYSWRGEFMKYGNTMRFGIRDETTTFGKLLVGQTFVSRGAIVLTAYMKVSESESMPINNDLRWKFQPADEVIEVLFGDAKFERLTGRDDSSSCLSIQNTEILHD